MPSVEQMWRALQDAHFLAGWQKKSAFPEADVFLIFAWRTGVQHWSPLPPQFIEGFALYHLCEKRPFLSKLFRSNWLEKRVISDIRFYNYFAKDAIIQTVADDKVLRVRFTGEVYKIAGWDADLNLQVIVSNALYFKYYKEILA